MQKSNFVPISLLALLALFHALVDVHSTRRAKQTLHKRRKYGLCRILRGGKGSCRQNVQARQQHASSRQQRGNKLVFDDGALLGKVADVNQRGNQNQQFGLNVFGIVHSIFPHFPSKSCRRISWLCKISSCSVL
uniref:Uncharacterized protein n=1 Tax=Siphoviridae sp. ct2hZ16 TaxID=2826276 RepID=A0A8S5QUD3_9CAUD|nr:MAG TPA: hypothetical protein [Siphoviridae sp. ct2hZ16]